MLTECKPRIHFVAEDDCCAEALSKALERGKLNDNSETWTHRKCGCEWISRLREDGVIQWTPVTIIEIIP